MTRLYLKGISDTNKNIKATANNFYDLDIFYGDSENSIKAFNIKITYPKNELKPLITVYDYRFNSEEVII